MNASETEQSKLGTASRDFDSRILWTASLLMFSVGLLGLYYQLPWVSLPSLGILLGLVVFTSDLAPLVGSSGLVIFVYLAPQSGWMYGRDSHAAIMNTRALETGKFSAAIPRSMEFGGFPKTPLLHYQTLITHKVSRLALVPTVEPQVLVGYVLPLTYLATSFGLIYVILRFVATWNMSKRDTIHLVPLAMLPVLLWQPHVKFASGLRRQSIGLVILLVGVFVLLHYAANPDKRFISIAVSIGIVLPLSHHLTSLMFLLLLGSLFIASVLLRGGSRLADLEAYVSDFSITMPLLAGVVFVVWFMVIGSTILIAEPILTFVLDQASTKPPNLRTTPVNPAITLGAEPLNQLANTSLRTFQSFLALFLYAGLLGFLLTLGVLNMGKDRKYDDYLFYVGLSMFLFGVTVALFALFTQRALPLDKDRVLTFFVLIGGGVGMVLFWRCFVRVRRSLRTPVVVIVIVIFLILSGAMVSPHVYSDNNADFDRGLMDQRFHRGLYAYAGFLDTHVRNNRALIGDMNIQEFGRTLGNQEVTTGGKEILIGKIPPETAVVLTATNDHLYKGNYAGGTLFLRPEPGELEGRFDRVGNRVYSNGYVTQYVGQ